MQYFYYTYSDKTSFSLLADRVYEEPGSFTLDSIVSNRIKVVGTHKLTPKIHTKVKLGDTLSAYDGEYYYKGMAYDREDDEYEAGVVCTYQVQDWLGVRASYPSYDRVSSIGALAYTDHRALLGLTLEL